MADWLASRNLNIWLINTACLVLKLLIFFLCVSPKYRDFHQENWGQLTYSGQVLATLSVTSSSIFDAQKFASWLAIRDDA